MVNWAGIDLLLFYLAIAAYSVAACFAFGRLVKQIRAMNHGLKVALVFGLVCNGLAIAARTNEAGHLPFAGMYEFGIVLVFFTALVGKLLVRRDDNQHLFVFVLPIIVILAYTVGFSYHGSRPLVPALKSHWLTVHVAAAVAAYGLLAVACATATMYLWKQRLALPEDRNFGPSLERLDVLAGQLVSWAMPPLTLLIVTGAIWAEYAWGTYWQWDPKETWSLITWVIFAIYLHGRRVLGWRGQKSMGLIILGFTAVLITFVGINLLKQGLHAYF